MQIYPTYSSKTIDTGLMENILVFVKELNPTHLINHMRQRIVFITNPHKEMRRSSSTNHFLLFYKIVQHKGSKSSKDIVAWAMEQWSTIMGVKFQSPLLDQRCQTVQEDSRWDVDDLSVDT